ncbi:MAG: hypothetical protein PX483_05390 [Nostocales cyanobacterium LE14-WE4]|nr:hypothetical protein [Nostocales cyanobacterium LE14-WE4]
MKKESEVRSQESGVRSQESGVRILVKLRNNFRLVPQGGIKN